MLRTVTDMNVGFLTSVNGPGFGIDSYLHHLVTFYYIADHLFGLSPWLNETTAYTFPEPWRPGSIMYSMSLEPPVSNISFAEYVGSYRSNLFPHAQVSSNGTSLFLKSIKVNGILHPTSDKDRFLYDVVSPLEYTLYENNAKQYVDAIFGRDDVLKAVKSFTFKLEVDLRYDKKAGAHIIGWVDIKKVMLTNRTTSYM